jgi:hypothetical protein
VNRPVDNGLEDRAEVEGRLRDRLDHVANCRFPVLCALQVAAKIDDLFVQGAVV